MPTVLLITEQERLKRLFGRLERAGTLRLKVAPTFAQAEEEICARQPDYVFGEHIPELSNLALENFLHQLLSESSRVVLMAQSPADAAQLREADILVVDLSQSDDTLLGAIADLIPAAAPQPDNSPLPDPPPPEAPQKTKDLLRAHSDPRSGATPNRLRYGLLSVVLLVFLSLVVFQQNRRTATAPTVAREAGTPVAPAAELAAPAVVPAAKPAPAATRAAAPVPPVSARQRPQASSTRGPKVSKAVAQHEVAVVPVKRQHNAKPAAQSGVSGSGAPSALRHSVVVQQNDTVLKILTRDYGLTYRDALAEIPAIKTLNRISDLDKVQPGQTLQVPSSLRSVAPATYPQQAP